MSYQIRGLNAGRFGKTRILGTTVLCHLSEFYFLLKLPIALAWRHQSVRLWWGRIRNSTYLSFCRSMDVAGRRLFAGRNPQCVNQCENISQRSSFFFLWRHSSVVRPGPPGINTAPDQRYSNNISHWLPREPRFHRHQCRQRIRSDFRSRIDIGTRPCRSAANLLRRTDIRSSAQEKSPVRKHRALSFKLIRKCG